MQQWGYSGTNKEIYLYGLPGQAQSSPDEYVLYDTGSGILTYDTSTRDVKKNVRPLPFTTEQFMALRPVLFDERKNVGKGRTDIAGFIAEDVHEAIPNLATWGYRRNAGPDEELGELRITNWNMKGMVATTVSEVQKLIDRNEALEAQVADLTERLERLETLLAAA
jgi:hypothetical protein